MVRNFSIQLTGKLTKKFRQKQKKFADENDFGRRRAPPPFSPSPPTELGEEGRGEVARLNSSSKAFTPALPRRK